MSDFLSKKERSNLMSKIRSKNTKPELILRKFLFSLGYRYRIHAKELPGSPDILLPKYNTAIQVRGCFWHSHNCKYSRIPKSNKLFWKKKLQKNINRDKKNDRIIKRLGWNLIIIWECQIMIRRNFLIVQKKN